MTCSCIYSNAHAIIFCPSEGFGVGEIIAWAKSTMYRFRSVLDLRDSKIVNC